MHYFDSGNGNTADSLVFFNDHRQMLGEVVAAQGFSPHHEGPSPYTFILTDTHSNTLWLSGLAAGYHGEGPRAALRTLIDCGFPDDEAKQVLTRSPLRLRRELEPPPPVRRIDPRLAQREAPPLCRSRAGYDVRDR